MVVGWVVTEMTRAFVWVCRTEERKSLGWYSRWVDGWREQRERNQVGWMDEKEYAVGGWVGDWTATWQQTRRSGRNAYRDCITSV